MAIKSTVYKADLQITDLDRHYYANHPLTLALLSAQAATGALVDGSESAALRDALVACGGWEALADDEAGRAVLRALRLDAEASSPAAWREATGTARLGLEGFVAWVDAAFEAASFKPAAPPPEAVRVIITPLAQLMLRPFAAVVCPGADDRHLGAAPATHPLLSDAELIALGLPGRAERQQREALAFAHALAAPLVTLLRSHADAGGEPLSDSPLVQRLALDLAAQGRSLAEWQDPRPTLQVKAQPLERPLPVAADALPARVSASAVEALRRRLALDLRPERPGEHRPAGRRAGLDHPRVARRLRHRPARGRADRQGDRLPCTSRSVRDLGSRGELRSRVAAR